jgi:hypothetical protein
MGPTVGVTPFPWKQLYVEEMEGKKLRNYYHWLAPTYWITLVTNPAVVVVARVVSGDRTELMVAPITHGEPRETEGVFIPQSVKRHLGLDDEPSWVVLTELNRFVWPGPDIRPVKGGETPLYGAIPARLFEHIKQGISSQARSGRLQVPKRTE